MSVEAKKFAFASLGNCKGSFCRAGCLNSVHFSLFGCLGQQLSLYATGVRQRQNYIVGENVR